MRDFLRGLVYGNPLYGLTLTGRVPERLLDLPPDPWLGEPAGGGAILDGEFTLGGNLVRLGDDPWREAAMGRAALEELHAFAWMGDLKALASTAARNRGLALIDGWIAVNSRWRRLPWRADILARRLSAWLMAAEFLLSADDAGFHRRFLASTTAQARHLIRVAASAGATADAFATVRGLVHVGLCLPGFAVALAKAQHLLEREVELQILPDGGHYQRNPSLQMAVLRDLCDIRNALIADRAELPTALPGAIDRMTPMLRSLRLGDGGLAVFNGGHEEDRRAVDSILSQAGARGKAPLNSPHSGYQRLNAGNTVIIADTGAPPPPGADGLAHAGALAFEMSVGRQRLIVNCGPHGGDEGPWSLAMRGTAAHSTLVLGETNSAQITAEGGIGRRSPQVTSARGESEEGIWLQAEHDGYLPPFSARHTRRLTLDHEGKSLLGEDRVVTENDRKVPDLALRFHLHPRLRASLMGGGAGVLLRLSDGSGWRFEAAGGNMGLEESIYLGRTGERRHGEQIVVRRPAGGKVARLVWRLAEIVKD